MSRDKEKQKYVTRDGHVIKQQCFIATTRLEISGDDFLTLMGNIENYSEGFVKSIMCLVSKESIILEMFQIGDICSSGFSDGIIFAYKEENGNTTKWIRIPFNSFFDRNANDHWVYKITFHSDKKDPSEYFDEKSFTPFHSVGYVGMTSRHPLVRLEEHRRNMLSGKGHAMHKAWRSIYDLDNTIFPYIIILGNVKTKIEAFDEEEKFVDNAFGTGTIIPHGLNVIRGGMAGMRELHKLGLLSDREKTTGESRDEALEKLEQAPNHPHYVQGHVRVIENWGAWKVGEKVKNKSVWVRPHWRNIISEKVA